MTTTTLTVPLADPGGAATTLALMLAQLAAKGDPAEQAALLALFLAAYRAELAGYAHAFDDVFAPEFMAAAASEVGEPLIAWPVGAEGHALSRVG